jgi:hypothetical protein
VEAEFFMFHPLHLLSPEPLVLTVVIN